MTREEMRASAREVVAWWPPLSAEQREQLACALTPSMSEAAEDNSRPPVTTHAPAERNVHA